MKNVLVTGAGGFIGSWLVNRLADEKIHVFALVRNKKSNISKIKESEYVKIIYCDMDDISNLPNLIENVKVDIFYHFAWEGVGGAKRADYELQLKNVKNTCSLMETAFKMGCKKFLCAGTVSEKIAENILSMNTAAENNIYAICKSTAHGILKVLSRKFDIQLVWMRISNVYGPKNECGNIVNYILDSFKAGITPAMTKGEQPYDLIYIEDLVEALFLMGTRNLSKETYFIGSEETSTLRSLVEKIRDSYPSPVQVNFGAKPDDGLIYQKEWFDVSPLVEDTGYHQKFSIEEGIMKTVKETDN